MSNRPALLFTFSIAPWDVTERVPRRFLILGLLGVDEDTLRHEYYASFFSQQGAFDEAEFPLLIINMNRLVSGLGAYGNADDTLQEKIEAFLRHIGVTETEIQSIRDILLEP